MNCPSCGKENTGPEPRCPQCGAELTKKNCGLGTASLVLGICGALVGLAMVPSFALGPPAVFLSLGAGAVLLIVLGLILGIVALGQIGRSKGQLKGQGKALAGTIISGLGVLMIPAMLILMAILFPVFNQARGKARQASCLAFIRQVDMAVLRFADDHQGKLPDADHWADEIMPYVPNKHVFHCPDQLNKEALSGYAFNRALSGKNIADLDNPADTVLVFESDQGWNASGDISALPAQPRHNRGDNYGFGDGHAKWVARDEASSLGWEPSAQSLPESQGTEQHDGDTEGGEGYDLRP
jgi:uncharacterized protein (DUF983 family)